LNISGTNFAADLKYLPGSLKKFYCFGTKPEGKLKEYLQKEEKVGNNHLFLLNR